MSKMTTHILAVHLCLHNLKAKSVVNLVCFKNPFLHSHCVKCWSVICNCCISWSYLIVWQYNGFICIQRPFEVIIGMSVSRNVEVI